MSCHNANFAAPPSFKADRVNPVRQNSPHCSQLHLVRPVCVLGICWGDRWMVGACSRTGAIVHKYLLPVEMNPVRQSNGQAPWSSAGRNLVAPGSDSHRIPAVMPSGVQGVASRFSRW